MTLKNLIFAIVGICFCLGANAQASGVAIVEVITEPDIGDDTVKFIGTPSGDLELRLDQPDRLAAEDLSAGVHVSTLAEIGPLLSGQGYVLDSIVCDDAGSDSPSTGNVSTQTATFNIDPGETVTCQFKLAPASSCICPREGQWSVSNLPGAMVCTGTMSLTVPFPASGAQGELQIRDNCETLFGTDFSADTADITVHRQSSCQYKGVVGGEQEGIPMELEFTMDVHSEESISGTIYSQVSQQGMTCTTNRPFEMQFNE